MSNFDLKDKISDLLVTIIGGIIVGWLIQVLPWPDHSIDPPPGSDKPESNKFVNVDIPHSVKGWIEKYPVDR